MQKPERGMVLQRKPAEDASARKAARRRFLHAGHFAFMRAIVQGIDPKKAWLATLAHEDQADLRIIKSEIRRIRDEFAAAAKREGRPGTRRLIQLEVSELQAPTDLPTLEEFAHQEGMEDFSEAEQAERYQERYGDRLHQANGRERLIKRQLDALFWLQQLVIVPPRAGDAVSSWLAPAIAEKIEAAGILTLRQLVARINGLGQRWWNGIGGVGAGKAERVLAWLRHHSDSTGLMVGSHVERPLRTVATHQLAAIVAPATAVRPLEKFVVPAELDGTTGQFRAPRERCLLRARNDYEAIFSWILAKNGANESAQASSLPGAATGAEISTWRRRLSHTQRAYLKEAERLLLWAILARGKALSSLTTEDCTLYRDFLADPQPAEEWCGARGRPRWSPLWRPFEAPLAPAARRHALIILGSLYRFWVEQNYVVGNPFAGVSSPRVPVRRLGAGRGLTRSLWAFIEEQAAELPYRSTTLRLRFSLQLLYFTGLRRSEAVAAKTDDLEFVQYVDPDGGEVSGWILHVIGKGGKAREVPLPDDVVQLLSEYLVSRGLDANPAAESNRGVYLIGWASDLAENVPWSHPAKQSTDARQGISDGTLYEQHKAFFQRCSEKLSASDPRGAERLAKASTHWLRHTFGMHVTEDGKTPIKVVQEVLGHTTVATTTQYTTSEPRTRLRALKDYWKRSST